MDARPTPVPVVDVAYAIDGTVLPGDHRFLLRGEVARCLPWLAEESGVGIHPIRAARDDGGRLLLSRRARLLMRLPARLVAAASALSGQELEVGGATLQVGEAAVRDLVPHGTLYAYFVTADDGDEQAFVAQTSRHLHELRIPCKIVCGKRQAFAAGPRQVVGFSLMLHDLTREHSLCLQQIGLGPDRGLGCGIFVPHRSAAAAGSAPI